MSFRASALLFLASTRPLVATSSLSDDVTADIDLASASVPFPHYWKRCFGSGHALLGTRADWREHLQLAVNELGLGGLRFHGTLDDDMSVLPEAGNGYYFYNVDQVYDYMVNLGLTPVVELSFMPIAIANCTRGECPYAFSDNGGYKGVEKPPADFEEWYKLVRALAEHFVERYGIDQVSTWRFEVWNELWGMDYPHPYLDLYNASARAIRDADPNLRVGGPATARLEFVQDFIADTAAMGIPVDFISTHSYPSDAPCSRESPGKDDYDCFAHSVAATAEYAKKASLPFLITEYKDGLQGGPGFGHGGVHGDKAYASAFIIRNVDLLADKGLDVFSWWTFSDIFEEGWLKGVPFAGVYGLMNPQGVRKPGWRAFEALNKAGTERIPVAVNDPLLASSNGNATSTVNVFATVEGTDAQRGLQIFTANFGPMEGTTGKPWDPIARSVVVRVAGLSLPQRPVNASVTMIDDTTCNPYDEWAKMGSPQYPTPDQIQELNAASEPAQLQIPIVSDENGGATVTFTLQPYGVAHVQFPFVARQ